MMDPLNAMEPIVDYRTLRRWNTTEVPQYDIIVDDPSLKKSSPFKFDATLNQKIILWYISILSDMVYFVVKSIDYISGRDA